MKNKTEILLVVAVLAVAFFGYKLSCKDDIREDAYNAIIEKYKERAKSPSSVKYQPWDEVKKNTFIVHDSIYILKAWFESKNALGIPLKDNYYGVGIIDQGTISPHKIDIASVSDVDELREKNSIKTNKDLLISLAQMMYIIEETDQF